MRAILKKKRIDKNLTQAQVAEQVGIKREHYTRIELGYVNPSFPVFLKLKGALVLEDSDMENFDDDVKKTG